ncbi:hypothetical protein [Rubrivivax gelatinosus]|uniref:hypothetical protein n=1 Tax=Rubrivivax gelatinosus TaxID=28068 RepID=UPI0019032BFA|nr:hypothetical protein [Rubrivivax gelatinosus]
MGDRQGYGVVALVIIASGATYAWERQGYKLDDQPHELTRPVYSSRLDCDLDWGDEAFCEDGYEPASSGSGGGSGTSYGGGGGGRRVAFGPYYSAHEGYYYGYDGKKGKLLREPKLAMRQIQETLSTRQIVAKGGQYTNARGGFGTRARIFSGGG